MSEMMDGSGLIEVEFDREKKRIRMNFSGYDRYGDGCYRNDASILFFASNSYRSAFLSIGRELEKRFEENRLKDIEHLILPYIFNFRHCVELELKALYVAITNQSPKVIHSIIKLTETLERVINEINYDQVDISYLTVSIKEFNEIKSDILIIFSQLKSKVEEYNDMEAADEYYRYIFEKEKNTLQLKNPVIELDFVNTNELFINIRDLMDKLCMKIREIIYIQFSF